jgi:hypothetical protein
LWWRVARVVVVVTTYRVLAAVLVAAERVDSVQAQVCRLLPEPITQSRLALAVLLALPEQKAVTATTPYSAP